MIGGTSTVVSETSLNQERCVRLGILVLSGVLLAGTWSASATAMNKGDMDTLVGQPADIAPSAYQYRADRKADLNPPEAWVALMHCAGQALNKAADTNAPAIKKA